MDLNDLRIWVVYDHPPEFPSGFLARLHTLAGPTGEEVSDIALDALRVLIQQRVPYVLNFFPRSSVDNEHIIECWM